MPSNANICSGDNSRSKVSRPGSWWLGFGASLLLLAGLSTAFVPYWETNDDVGMAMLAHGFGLAAQGSPRLIFSNVVWGWLVRSIPSLMQTSGYAWATLAVLTCTGAMIFRAVHRLRHGMVVASLMLALVMLRPILFPQFTINAGLLCVGAIAAFKCYASGVEAFDRRAWIDLALGCVLAFLSYLVRSQEFLLVAAVGAPLLPWGSLVKRRAGQVALIVLAAAIAAAALVDRHSYRSEEWVAFKAVDAARAPFTDFGAGERLKQHPEILERHGLSRNDIDLISSWFFADSKLMETQRLQRMLDELGPTSAQSGGGQRAVDGLRTLWEPTLLSLSAAALALLLLKFSLRLGAVWLLTLAAAMAMGWFGRPGVTRVYVPLVALLLVAPCIINLPATGWRRKAGVAALAFGLLANASQIFSESRSVHADAGKLRQSMAGLSPQVIVVWGASFPYQLAYPVMGPSFAAGFRFYGLGVFTRAPVSTAFALEAQGEGLIRRLQSAEGLLGIIADLRWLEIYCQEHLGAKLARLQTLPFSGFTLQRIRCARPEGNSSEPNAKEES